MVALWDGVYAGDLLSIGLDRDLHFGSCWIFLGYPCLGQGCPIDLTCTTTFREKYLNTCCIVVDYIMVQIGNPMTIWHIVLILGYWLTWILLVLKGLHPLLLAQRPLRPRLSSLIPHLFSRRNALLRSAVESLLNYICISYKCIDDACRIQHAFMFFSVFFFNY